MCRAGDCFPAVNQHLYAPKTHQHPPRPLPRVTPPFPDPNVVHGIRLWQVHPDWSCPHKKWLQAIPTSTQSYSDPYRWSQSTQSYVVTAGSGAALSSLPSHRPLLTQPNLLHALYPPLWCPWVDPGEGTEQMSLFVGWWSQNGREHCCNKRAEVAINGQTCAFPD